MNTKAEKGFKHVGNLLLPLAFSFQCRWLCSRFKKKKHWQVEMLKDLFSTSGSV